MGFLNWFTETTDYIIKLLKEQHSIFIFFRAISFQWHICTKMYQMSCETSEDDNLILQWLLNI